MTNDYQDHALAIARQLIVAGTPIFVARAVSTPWNPHDSGKGVVDGYRLPVGWQFTLCDPSTLDTWRPGDALAAVCGRTLDVIDTDPRNGGDDTGLLGLLPTVHAFADTPSGGTHRFVAKLDLPKGKFGDGLDLQAGLADAKSRGFVWIAPTLRPAKPSGELRYYTWRFADFGSLATDTSGNPFREHVIQARETLRVRHAPKGTPSRSAQPAAQRQGLDRVFSDTDALAFIETHALARVRETPWADDFWRVLFEAALTCANFVEMFDEEYLKDLLRTAIIEGHGADADRNDEGHIAAGFAKGGDWSARRPNADDFADPFGQYGRGTLATDMPPRRQDALDDAIETFVTPTPPPPPPLKDVGAMAPTAPWHLPEEFWEARDMFALLRQSAFAAMESPEGVMAAAISLTLAHVGPNIWLPAPVGTPQPLNAMTVIVGRSGDGKSVCRKLASQVLHFDGFLGELHRFNPSSGQGISGQYQKLNKGDMEPIRWNALAMVEESDSIAALTSNKGNTLSSELRKAAMGEDLGFGNIGDTKTNLTEGTYRFVLLMCMQPELAGWLLSDAYGGLPQRFLWACVRDDRDIDGLVPPARWTVTLPDIARLDAYNRPKEKHFMTITPRITEEVRAARKYRKKNGDSPERFDGHAILLRMKVAAAIAIMNERLDIDDKDWHLAEMLTKSSDAARTWVQDILTDAEAKEDETAGMRRGRVNHHAKAVEVDESEATKARCAKRVLDILKAGPIRGRDLRSKVTASQRPVLDDITTRLVEANLIVATPTLSAEGHPGTIYSLCP